MKSLMNIAEPMTSLYESLFDIDDNIDNLNPEVMYGLWNAKTGDEYEKIGEMRENQVHNLLLQYYKINQKHQYINLR